MKTNKNLLALFALVVFLAALADAPLDWAVIGAASNGKKHYQPDPEVVRNVLCVLDSKGIPVFFKGNLCSNAAATPWREEYPV